MPVFILRPQELIRFGQISYSKPSSLSLWTGVELIDSGLFPGEKELFSALPRQSGGLLLLGMGGGREAIFLARAGFRVTGVDFIAEMVEKAMEYARQKKVEIKGVVGEISRLKFNPNSFDVVWYSCSIYSATPGKKARIETLKRVGEWLTPQGLVVCGFFWNPAVKLGRFKWQIGKVFSRLTFGNTKCEQGDILVHNMEFLHAFASKADLLAEFAEAGFELVQFCFPENSHHAGALLRQKR